MKRQQAISPTFSSRISSRAVTHTDRANTKEWEKQHRKLTVGVVALNKKGQVGASSTLGQYVLIAHGPFLCLFRLHLIHEVKSKASVVRVQEKTAAEHIMKFLTESLNSAIFIFEYLDLFDRAYDEDLDRDALFCRAAKSASWMPSVSV